MHKTKSNQALVYNSGPFAEIKTLFNSMSVNNRYLINKQEFMFLIFSINHIERNVFSRAFRNFISNHLPFHIPQLFQYPVKIEVLFFLSAFFQFYSEVNRDCNVHYSASYLFLLIITWSIRLVEIK